MYRLTALKDEIPFQNTIAKIGDEFDVQDSEYIDLVKIGAIKGAPQENDPSFSAKYLTKGSGGGGGGAVNDVVVSNGETEYSIVRDGVATIIEFDPKNEKEAGLLNNSVLQAILKAIPPVSKTFGNFVADSNQDTMKYFEVYWEAEKVSRMVCIGFRLEPNTLSVEPGEKLQGSISTIPIEPFKVYDGAIIETRLANGIRVEVSVVDSRLYFDFINDTTEVLTPMWGEGSSIVYMSANDTKITLSPKSTDKEGK